MTNHSATRTALAALACGIAVTAGATTAAAAPLALTPVAAPIAESPVRTSVEPPNTGSAVNDVLTELAMGSVSIFTTPVGNRTLGQAISGSAETATSPISAVLPQTCWWSRNVTNGPYQICGSILTGGSYAIGSVD